MTASELTVYGRPLHSLWDRRIGGRYELVAITDTGGTGMWVTLRRVGGGHELAMSVSSLGVNYVCVEAEPAEDKRFPVVTLCGSTKFKDEILAENARLTIDGNLVISLGVFGHTDLPDYDWSTDVSDLKTKLDRMHFVKIDMADSVHVVNPGGYIGESTAREIAYAESKGKPVTYMEPAPVPLLPWAINPGWYRGKRGTIDEGYAYDLGVGERTPTDCEPGDAYERVAVIPWDLIERLRQSLDSGWTPSYLVTTSRAVLDAADGAE